MLGFHMSVYRQTDEGVAPATFDSPEGPRLAVWQTDAWGLDWLNDLVKAGRAIDSAVVAACRPDEWLLVQAWDES